MSNRRIIMGIDTSNYTTSVALMYEDGELIANIKIPLPVKDGGRGLRQSDALFAHIKNLPIAMEKAKKALNGIGISAVGVSTKPRNIEGSYMPCFLAGVASAESVSAALGIPLYKFSHQCGHIMAAVYSASRNDLLDGREFCAFHVSGGTTEMLKVKNGDSGFSAELIGGTADLNAGQVIDRIGVYMGLSFPAGQMMQELALENTQEIPKVKPKIKDFDINLSGLENMAMKLYNETSNKPFVSAFVFEYIKNSLCLLADAYISVYGNTDFVFAGGVMSNSIIKSAIKEKYNASFAEPQMSSDNAVGIAELTRREFLK